MSEQQKGLIAAVLSPLFLGMAPVLGKFALVGGADPFTVAALRTGLVAVLLWTFYALVWRQFIYIYSAGLMACIAVGFTNGIGSLFYYTGLDFLDASVAQLLNSTYVIFVVLLTRIAGDRVTSLTLVRIVVAMVGVLFITGGLGGDATWLGIGFMMGNALLFAGTVVMSQRILYEMPAQTVTLYVMTAMAAVVIVARLIASPTSIEPIQADAMWAILVLAVTTALSRLTLFAGVKGVGSVRAALAAVAESAVAVFLAFVFLDERLSMVQWMGVAALVASLFMPTGLRHATEETNDDSGGSLPNIAGWRFQRMSNPNRKYSTQEMRKLVTLLVGSMKDLSETDRAYLRDVLGEDGFKKLEDLETTQSRQNYP